MWRFAEPEPVAAGEPRRASGRMESFGKVLSRETAWPKR